MYMTPEVLNPLARLVQGRYPNKHCLLCLPSRHIRLWCIFKLYLPRMERGELPRAQVGVYVKGGNGRMPRALRPS